MQKRKNVISLCRSSESSVKCVTFHNRTNHIETASSLKKDKQKVKYNEHRRKNINNAVAFHKQLSTNLSE